MGRKAYDGVYKDDKGIYWTYHKGKKKTPNMHGTAWDLHSEMVKAEQCAEVQRSERAPLEVYILRGVPGSGKTTWAKAFIEDCPWFKRVSRDMLRQMFDFGDYSSQKEKFIRRLRLLLIGEILQEGFSVIVDDTNLKEQDIREIREAAWRYSRIDGRDHPMPIRVINFQTPLAECIRRDALRENPVGADRITAMHYDFWLIDSDEEMEAYRAAKKRLGQDRWGWWWA